MSASKRFRAPLAVMFGVLTAMVTFAGPASAEDNYPAANGTQVLSNGTTSVAPAATGALAFTGSNAIGAGAVGGLLLVGGGVLLVAGKRRKVNG